jgi:hypothetical protein
MMSATTANSRKAAAKKTTARKAAPKTKAKAPAARTTKATAAELIADGKLKIGTKLTATYKGTKVNAKIADAEGQVKIGRELHASPSSAAKAVSGNARNGFIFWKLEDGRQLGSLRG